MKLVGYADKLSVQPGSEIGFMVSSEFDTFQAALVRLIHGDVNPAGPGFKAEPVDSALTGTYPGVRQPIRTGSYVRVPHRAELDLGVSFTIHMWIRPTTPDKERQTLLSKVSEAGDGYALRLDRGRLSLHVGPGLAAVARVERPVEAHAWYAVSAVYDADLGEARLRLDPLAPTAVELAAAVRASLPTPAALPDAGGDLLIAAEAIAERGEPTVGSFYNGKIDAPRVFASALDETELAALRDGAAPASDSLVAAWDFSVGIPTSAIADTSGRQLDGRTVNKPMRGATGWNWDGTETAWPHARGQYGAIHFHDDDLDDAAWTRSLGFGVPDDLPSGVYAVHLQAEGEEDYIPFAVRPRRGRPTSKVLWVMPVFSYLAYGNEHLVDQVRTMDVVKLGLAGLLDYPSTPQDRYIAENRLNSLYDTHSDGSGVCYSSRLRPLVTMRPKYEMPLLNRGQGSPHQFNADLHIVDWLHESGYAFDVVTDEDLHAEGAELLSSYKVVLTGSHHEYWSLEMIRAAQRYLTEGGRLMYLAGNGMYWVTQQDSENGNGIEVRRRPPSTRVWETEPGEGHLSATGELGGLWRYRGIAPQSWLGVGFTAQGLGEGRPYERRPDSFSERGAWVFEGVARDELIGDFPSLVNSRGAAGFELDRADRALGTPLHTLILATATGFSDSYQHVSEEVMSSNSRQGGSASPLVRADMVLLEYPGGGAVFSPGSIAWSACLSYNDYDNNVARITANVLDRFLSN